MEYRNLDYSLAFAKHEGFHPITEEKNTISPMAPWLLMDIAYQLYQQNIAGTPWRHKMAKYKKQWANAYTAFNSRLFRSFDAYPDMQDQFIDKMDEFYQSVDRNIQIAFLKCMDCFMDMANMEHQRVLATALICNLLATLAENIYTMTFHHREQLVSYDFGHVTQTRCRKIGEYHTELKGYMFATKEFAREYIMQNLRGQGINEVVAEKHVTALREACKAMENRLVVWIIDEDKKNQVN